MTLAGVALAMLAVIAGCLLACVLWGLALVAYVAWPRVLR